MRWRRDVRSRRMMLTMGLLCVVRRNVIGLLAVNGKDAMLKRSSVDEELIDGGRVIAFLPRIKE